MTQILYNLLPDSFQNAVQLWVEHGYEPGSCLRAMLKNDFVDAVCHAHPTTVFKMQDIARFLVNELPAQAWGSPEKYEAWKAKGGLFGNSD